MAAQGATADIAYVAKDNDAWILGHLLRQALSAKTELDNSDGESEDDCGDSKYDQMLAHCEQKEKEFLVAFLCFPDCNLKCWLCSKIFSGLLSPIPEGTLAMHDGCVVGVLKSSTTSLHSVWY